MKTNRLLIILILVVIIGMGIFLAVQRSEHAALRRSVNKEPEQKAIFNDPIYGLNVRYPVDWGPIATKEGNMVCPEEDTYRTQDTLSMFNHEFQFPEVNLPNTDSFVRMAIRVRDLSLSEIYECGEDFLVKVSTREIKGEELSSVQLMPLGKEPFSGYYNSRASRLNTEGRKQYTFFYPDQTGERVLVVQPYFSFVPVADSPELKEMETKFNGDIETYIEKGVTSAPLRSILEDFDTVAQTITIQR